MKGQPMKRITLCLAALGMFSLYAQDIPAGIEKQLNDDGRTMTALALAGDYEEIIEFYTEDAVIMPDFQPPIRGRDALMRQYKKDEKKGTRFHSLTGSVEKRWMRGNEIFEIGSFGMAVSSHEDARPQAFYGSYFQIWEKQSDGAYRISFNIWNLDFNPFETN